MPGRADTPATSIDCLNLDHEIGGPKAHSSQLILGIGLADVEYLADTLRAGILQTPITDVRDNAPFGVLCEVRILVVGLHERQGRVVAVTSSWELRHAEERPWLAPPTSAGNLE